MASKSGNLLFSRVLDIPCRRENFLLLLALIQFGQFSPSIAPDSTVESVSGKRKNQHVFAIASFCATPILTPNAPVWVRSWRVGERFTSRNAFEPKHDCRRN